MGGEISIGRIIEALSQLGYEVVLEEDGFVVLDDMSGPNAPFPIVFDASHTDIPIEDVIDQIEEAGIDRAAFFAQLDATL